MNTPRNVIFVLLDSLNRHCVGCYGGTEFDTPTLDALAKRGVRFTRHHVGSLPCMPARHDLLCGAQDFLWKPWGSIELWERPVTFYLRKAGVVAQLISDHPHLFEHGGENYHADFFAWDYLRGHESDPWQTIVDETMIGTPTYHRAKDNHYHRNRRKFHREEDFPGPKTMAATERWLDENADQHDRFFLFVDEFDPHEPFDTPEPYASMYDSSWQGRKMIWPPYQLGAIKEREARQIRAQYGGKLTMIDRWLGRVVDSIERNGLWDDTLLIVTADHGVYLGEHDCWGKPPSPVFRELGHIPLLMCGAGIEPGTTCDALTTSVDLCETFLDAFGVTKTRQRRHGHSILPLLRGEEERIRDWVLSGYWSQRLHLITEDMKYARGVRDPNELAIYSNRWSTMPPIRLPDPDERATLGPHMPGSGLPVIRQPLDTKQIGRLLWCGGDHRSDHLYDFSADPNETQNLAGDPSRTAQLEQQLLEVLREREAPPELLRRFGYG